MITNRVAHSQRRETDVLRNRFNNSINNNADTVERSKSENESISIMNLLSFCLSVWVTWRCQNQSLLCFVVVSADSNVSSRLCSINTQSSFPPPDFLGGFKITFSLCCVLFLKFVFVRFRVSWHLIRV